MSIIFLNPFYLFSLFYLLFSFFPPSSLRPLLSFLFVALLHFIYFSTSPLLHFIPFSFLNSSLFNFLISFLSSSSLIRLAEEGLAILRGEVQVACFYHLQNIAIEKSQVKNIAIAWFYMILYDIIWYDLVWYDLIWYDMIWFDMIWYDIIWFDMIWFNLIWYDMIWYDLILFHFI